jgi:hypothetical protein
MYIIKYNDGDGTAKAKTFLEAYEGLIELYSYDNEEREEWKIKYPYEKHKKEIEDKGKTELEDLGVILTLELYLSRIEDI